MDDSSSYWKQNLKVAWLGNFLTGTSFTLVMPFISVFVEELGVGPGLVEYYAGACCVNECFCSGLDGTDLGEFG